MPTNFLLYHLRAVKQQPINIIAGGRGEEETDLPKLTKYIFTLFVLLPNVFSEQHGINVYFLLKDHSMNLMIEELL